MSQKRTNLLLVSGLLVLLAGCNQAPNSSPSLEEGMNSAINCKSGTGPVDPSELEIRGTVALQKGETAHYQLSQDLSCSNSQKVIWKTVAVAGSNRIGSEMNSTFNKVGNYVISAQVLTAKSTIPYELSFKTTVINDAPTLIGPQITMVGVENNFDLGIPSNMDVASVDWNFGDGSAVQNSLGPLTHTYGRAGTYQMSVMIKDGAGSVTTLNRSLLVLPLQDGQECVYQLGVSGPYEVTVGQPVLMSVFIPSCVSSKVTAISWNFGDQSPLASNQTVEHTFTEIGASTVTVQLFTTSTTNPWVTLTHRVNVIAKIEVPSPTPTPGPTPDLNECPLAGQQRQGKSDLYSETEACGVNGTKIKSFRDVVVDECRNQSGILKWIEVSKNKELQSEGACQGLACEVPAASLSGVDPQGAGFSLINGKYYLLDGASKTFFSSTSPTGSCASVSESRSCANGQLGGSSAHQFLNCNNGCEGFGLHGTVKTGVTTGEIKVSLTCGFGEQGFFNLFHQVSDQTCQNGQIQTTNTRQGDLKTAGSCPTYSHVGTDVWSECSDNCGGKQTRIFQCQSNLGDVVSSDRCVGAAPSDERLCDANPAAVAREDRETSVEEAGASNLCPANQIGVIINKRDVTLIKSYACIEHSVQLAGTQTTYGAWTTENYCRNYVPNRCNHDSLSNTEAKGRYKWMQKCRSQVPLIEEFLTKFDDVSVETKKKGHYGIDEGSRFLYPTFMDRSKMPEKAWIAPKGEAGSCTVPSSVYVAAVCVSSCATPEQQILTQVKSERMKYSTFIEALTQKHDFVMTLQSSSSISSKDLQKTRVENWVTELLDTEHDILIFKMKSGGQLKVTPNHPLVSGDGQMVMAREFKVGQSLVRVGGQGDQILSITPGKHFGKVYNVFVKSADLHKNIVVTNGYLNGTAFYQNEGAKNMNRDLFRQKLVRGVLEK
ncbi:MAG: PKD domain-containing protein [Bdellovibrio sp.]